MTVSVQFNRQVVLAVQPDDDSIVREEDDKRMKIAPSGNDSFVIYLGPSPAVPSR